MGVDRARAAGMDPDEGTVGTVADGRELSPPALFHAREQELTRFGLLHENVRTALLYGPEGVGKSALAYEVARTWPHRVVYQRAAKGQSLQELLTSAHASLTPEDSCLEGEDDRARLRELADIFDGEQVLWVLDDLDNLSEDDALLLLRKVASRLTTGRLLTTSRKRLGHDASGPHRLEIELTGFAREQASALWQKFDAMYGTAGSFEVAFRRSAGNPRMLRSAHAAEAVSRHGHIVHVEKDGRSVTCGSERVELGSRPILRKMFHSLVSSPSERVSKEALVLATWGRDYNPRSDDSPLWVNIGRLRKLLDALPLVIESDDGGYRLVLEPGVRVQSDA